MATNARKSFDYDAVAPRYDAHRKTRGPFVDALVHLAREARAQRVLEIGCGTGNSTAAFLNQHPCALTGIDLSRGMLREAQRKNLAARFVQSDAHALPFRDAAFDYAFAVLVIHHLDDLERFFGECRRVLGDGILAIVTASHDFIERHPMAAYFPSFAAIDKARFPDIPMIVEGMHSAGFTAAGTIETKSPPQPIDRVYTEKVAAKFISTYDLIPDDEFAAGLDRLRRDVEKQGQLDTPLEWESTIVWAR